MNQILRNELLLDPLGRGYAGMTDEAAAADLNTENITVAAGEIDPFAVDNAVPNSEREALRTAAPAFYDKWQAILSSRRPIDVKSADMQAALSDLAAVFSAPTVAAINALGNKYISRAAQLKLGVVGDQQVLKARA